MPANAGWRYNGRKTVARVISLLPWFIQEFDLDAFSIMCSAGVYLICHQPSDVFREEYLPMMRELVGTQRIASRQEEMYELFARTLASRVSVGYFVIVLCLHAFFWFCFILFLRSLCSIHVAHLIKLLCHKQISDLRSRSLFCMLYCIADFVRGFAMISRHLFVADVIAVR